MKKIKGKPVNITKWITGKITTKNNIFDRNRIVVCEKLPLIRFGAKCFLVNETPDCKTAAVQINAPSPFQEGDIISINPNGDCTVVWEKNSCHNAWG